ncbi:RES family NAD+ phosphorylase [Sandaracinobacteroides saxicola]|uniref:RES family NAD+ phosphorylase n=1 Tax=Sandaracinobacteroides saxicola TaxID=2759707 RepID=A0A7G5IKN1_9SPHN|nr:RES family NAD+ phosphorylase [Sandaracinobacteroides saxicola]QMW23923.1 RES family NAD+ phosphorylase [Sandaracinobacteroides saxicola]
MNPPTPADFRPYAGLAWRLVEGQHRISTNRLTDSGADQARLETLLESAKPHLPAAAQHLPWLLASPFRYGHASASRFRAAHEKPGIFYAADNAVTPIWESAYHRLRFFARAPGATPPTGAVDHSLFNVPIRTDRLLDLTLPPFDKERWTHPDDYAPTQAFAAQARSIATAALRAPSARHPGGITLPILDPAVFIGPPSIAESWSFRHEGDTIVAIPAFPSTRLLRFTYARFGLPA